jgi:hypothetical protein
MYRAFESFIVEERDDLTILIYSFLKLLVNDPKEE